MCVYNGHRVSLNEFIRLKNMEKSLRALEQNVDKVQNGFDSSEWPLIVRPNAQKNGYEEIEAHWGFMPSYIPSGEFYINFRKEHVTLNARGETILSSPLYRDGALNGRCLIPSSYFFEYRTFDQVGKKGQVLKAKRKVPYVISVKNRDLFFFAGISQPCYDAESREDFVSYAMVTTDATHHLLMSQIHNAKLRMPVILPEDLADRWIMDDLSENGIRELASYQFPSEMMQAHTLSKDFKTSSNPTQEVFYDDVPPLVTHDTAALSFAA